MKIVKIPQMNADRVDSTGISTPYSLESSKLVIIFQVSFTSSYWYRTPCKYNPELLFLLECEEDSRHEAAAGCNHMH
mgnify:CR=1 FL=1